MAKSIQRRLGGLIGGMAVRYCVLCVLVLCSCHPRSVSQANLTPYASPTADTVALAVDSSTGSPEIVEVPIETAPSATTAPIVKQDVPAPMPLAPKLTLPDIYLSQVGVTEATGHNDGKSVEMYLRSVRLTKGYAWCAAFVKWCFDSAHIKTKINGAAASCYSKDLAIYQNKKMTQEPKAGDVFTLYYLSLGRIGHTGFYHNRLNSSVFMSCEGNTGQGGSVDAGTREGDGVYKKYRSFNATYAICRFVQ